MPSDIKTTQNFLGFTGFYYFRKFVLGYATIARPLTDLIKKNIRFSFGDKETKAFNLLKEILCNKSVLAIYSPMSNYTPSCQVKISEQHDSEVCCFHLIYFASAKTSTVEAKLHSYKLEVLAVVKAVKKV